MPATDRACKVRCLAISLISFFLQGSAALGQYGHIIDKKISNLEYEKIKYLVVPYSEKISNENILIKKFDYFTVIRIIHEDLCEKDFCLNIIVRNCDKTNCPSTVIIGPDRFIAQRMPIDKLGLIIKFATRVDNNYTNVIVNSRYVAAAQGL